MLSYNGAQKGNCPYCHLEYFEHINSKDMKVWSRVTFFSIVKQVFGLVNNVGYSVRKQRETPFQDP